ncbi:putative multi-domain containing protein [Aduncisulcus paluster]|uniref:Multi-domain containing protein n=1 Tax=Aduncisulcus paluster TaxID=2918883 RepID=A0ABQ5JZD8_9EUKA|nr:putative multi-domain containing protein [Aduncisulcus paluster]
MDFSNVQSAVTAAADPRSDRKTKIKALEIILTIKKSISPKDLSDLSFKLFLQPQTQHKHFGLSLLQHLFEKRWDSCNQAEKDHAMGVLNDILTKGLEAFDEDDPAIKNKVSSLTAMLAKVENCEYLPAVCDSLLRISDKGHLQLGIALQGLAYTCEDLMSNATMNDSTKVKVVKSLSSVTPKIVSLLENVYKTFLRQVEQAYIKSIVPPSYLTTTLLISNRTCAVLCEYMPISLFMSLVNCWCMCCLLPPLRISAYVCLYTFCTKANSKDNKQRDVIVDVVKFFISHKENIARGLGEEVPSLLYESHKPFIVLWSQLFNRHFQVIFGTDIGLFQESCKLMLEFCAHPSPLLFANSMPFWITIYRDRKICGHEGFDGILKVLVKQIVSKNTKTRMLDAPPTSHPSSSDVMDLDGFNFHERIKESDFGHPSYMYLIQDFENNESWSKFFQKMRGRICECIRICCLTYPIAVLHASIEILVEMLQISDDHMGEDEIGKEWERLPLSHGKVPYAVTMTHLSPLYRKLDSVCVCVEAAVTSIAKNNKAMNEVRRRSGKMEESIYDKDKDIRNALDVLCDFLMKYNGNHAVLRERVVSVFVSLSDYLAHAPETLLKVVSCIFDRIIWIPPYEREESSKSLMNLSDCTLACRKKACSTLQTLCDLREIRIILTPHLDSLYKKVRDLADNQQLTEVELVSVYDAQTSLVMELKPDVRDRLVQTLLQPHASVFTDKGIVSILSNPESFVQKLMIGKTSPSSSLMEGSGDSSSPERIAWKARRSILYAMEGMSVIVRRVQSSMLSNNGLAEERTTLVPLWEGILPLCVRTCCTISALRYMGVSAAVRACGDDHNKTLEVKEGVCPCEDNLLRSIVSTPYSLIGQLSRTIPPAEPDSVIYDRKWLQSIEMACRSIIQATICDGSFMCMFPCDSNSEREETTRDHIKAGNLPRPKQDSGVWLLEECNFSSDLPLHYYKPMLKYNLEGLCISLDTLTKHQKAASSESSTFSGTSSGSPVPFQGNLWERVVSDVVKQVSFVIRDEKTRIEEGLVISSSHVLPYPTLSHEMYVEAMTSDIALELIQTCGLVCGVYGKKGSKKHNCGVSYASLSRPKCVSIALESVFSVLSRVSASCMRKSLNIFTLIIKECTGDAELFRFHVQFYVSKIIPFILNEVGGAKANCLPSDLASDFLSLCSSCISVFFTHGGERIIGRILAKSLESEHVKGSMSDHEYESFVNNVKKAKSEKVKRNLVKSLLLEKGLFQSQKDTVKAFSGVNKFAQLALKRGGGEEDDIGDDSVSLADAVWFM